MSKVAESLRQFGWQQPLVVDSEGVLVVGHTRLLAAQSLGLKQVPVVVASGLSPAQVRAYRLADNRTHDESAWIDELLGEELRLLDVEGFDLTYTGFDQREVARAIGGAVRREVAGEDDAPEVPPEPVTKPGDRWVLGDHVLVCGDATSAPTVATLLGGAVPGLMVSDPPYGVLYDASWRAAAGLSQAGKRPGSIANDDRADWREAWALFPGSAAYVWAGGLHLIEAAAGLAASGFSLRAQIVWVKSRFAISRGHYHWQHEPALYAARGEETGFVSMRDFERPEPAEESMIEEQETAWYAARGAANWSGSRGESTVWTIPFGGDGAFAHPTQKPVECMLRPMLNNSRRGDAVYDPFVGSGTSVIAAEKSGRRCYAIELSPGFCDVVVERWQAFSGGKAKRNGR